MSLNSAQETESVVRMLLLLLRQKLRKPRRRDQKTERVAALIHEHRVATDPAYRAHVKAAEDKARAEVRDLEQEARSAESARDTVRAGHLRQRIRTRVQQAKARARQLRGRGATKRRYSQIENAVTVQSVVVPAQNSTRHALACRCGACTPVPGRKWRDGPPDQRITTRAQIDADLEVVSAWLDHERTATRDLPGPAPLVRFRTNPEVTRALEVSAATYRKRRRRFCRSVLAQVYGVGVEAIKRRGLRSERVYYVNVDLNALAELQGRESQSRVPDVAR